jgi:putative methionine-R-sulfoxide reductase with GAF domain
MLDGMASKYEVKDAPAIRTSRNWLLIVAQVILGVIGLAGFYLRAFPVQIHTRAQNWPVFDLTTLAWLIPIAFAILLPNISEVTWGAFSVKLDQLREATAKYETALDNLAYLVQNWSTLAALYVKRMGQPESDLLETKANMCGDYVRDRMGEAYEVLAKTPQEALRLGLWLYNPVKREIVFTSGFRLSPEKTTYLPGEGMLGKAFAESRQFNEADVRNVPSYVSSRGGEDPPYRAVLCAPVRWDDETIGVITVDRPTAGFFDYLSEQVTQGLAAQCALAVKVYEASQASTSSSNEPAPGLG